MKTTAECYKALLDGYTLLLNDGSTVKLKEGFQVDENGDRVGICYKFSHPEEWEIKREYFDLMTIMKKAKEEEVVHRKDCGYVLVKDGNHFTIRNGGYLSYNFPIDLLSSSNFYIKEKGE